MMTGSAVSKDDTSSLRGIPCAATVDLGDQFIASDWEQPLSLHFGFDGEPAPCFYNVVEPQSWENQGDVLGKQVSTPPKLTDDPSGVGPCNGMFSKSKKRKSTSECSKTASCLPVNRIKEVEVETKKGKASGSNAGRSIVKQARDDHIHIRAKRGHATSSHSLAERVRREKINQRMRFLQELVPGCSKLTGKAVMLDEIINYVQSLQRQVEFLSMKLAAMEPAEQTIDSNSAVPTDIPVTREEKFAAMLIGFAMSSGLPYQDIGPQEFVNMSMTQEMVISNSINSVQAAIHRQNHEVHRMMQMGFLPKIPLGNTEVQGIIKRQQTTSCGPEHVLE